MPVRTTKKTMTFVNAFSLGTLDEVLPPGTYEIETNEELLEGLSFPAYRRTLALLHLPALESRRGTSRTVMIDPNELDAALKRDATAPELTAAQEPSKTKPETREADRLAVDRGENEGMVIRSD